MKFLIILLLTLTISLEVYATDQREDLRGVMLELQKLTKRQTVELDDALSANDQLNTKLQMANRQLMDTEEQVSILKMDIKRFEEWANTAHKRAQMAEESLEKIKSKLIADTQYIQRLKWIICGCLAVLVIFVALRFSIFFPIPWGWIVPFLTGIIAFLLAWLFV